MLCEKSQFQEVTCEGLHLYNIFDSYSLRIWGRLIIAQAYKCGGVRGRTGRWLLKRAT